MTQKTRSLKEWLRAFFSPHFCQRGEHRWLCSQGVDGYYRCKDCFKYVSIKEYRST